MHWLPALSYAALIFVLSHQSDPLGPEFPPFVPDYFLHCLEYGFFAVTLVWGLTSRFYEPLSLRLSLAAWLMAFLYAITDELHQSFIPEREASLADLAADAGGALLFVSALGCFRRVRRGAGKFSNGLRIHPNLRKGKASETK